MCHKGCMWGWFLPCTWLRLWTRNKPHFGKVSRIRGRYWKGIRWKTVISLTVIHYAFRIPIFFSKQYGQWWSWLIYFRPSGVTQKLDFARRANFGWKFWSQEEDCWITKSSGKIKKRQLLLIENCFRRSECTYRYNRKTCWVKWYKEKT